jgi:uncharacterized membrane protein HdeD (DUF308 family)
MAQSKGAVLATNETQVRPGEGWIAFAGIVLAIAGFINFIWGIAAIDDSAFFTDEGRYVLFDDLSTWGWFFLIVGLLQMVAAVSIWNRNAFGRIFGILSASLNILVLLFTVNAYPFAAFMLFLIDVLVIYGLVVYGGHGVRQEPQAARVEADTPSLQSGRETLQPPLG